MNHDSFCFQSQGRWDGGCICFALAEARADEREKTAEHLRTYLDGSWIRPEIVEIWVSVLRFEREAEQEIRDKFGGEQE